MRNLYRGSLALLALTVMAVGIDSSDVAGQIPERGVAFGADSYTPTETVVFHVKDDALGTVASCTGTWTGLPGEVAAGTSWSLATGAPDAGVFALDQACAYRRTAPGQTPISGPPSVRVNVLEYLTTSYGTATGEFTLAGTTPQGATAIAGFDHFVVDTLAPGERRARVYSTVDPDGEWVALA